MHLKQKTYAVIEAKYSCAHQSKELRHRTIADGRQTYVYQCIRCGHTSSPIKAKKAKALSGERDIPKYDNCLQEKWRFAKSTDYFLEYQRIRPELASEYKTYLRSDAWQKIKTSVLSRAGGQCEVCNNHPATDIHHITYCNIFNENHSGLLAVCHWCHEEIHGKNSES